MEVSCPFTNYTFHANGNHLSPKDLKGRRPIFGILSLAPAGNTSEAVGD